MSIWEETYNRDGIKAGRCEIDVVTAIRFDPFAQTNTAVFILVNSADCGNASIRTDLTPEQMDALAAILTRSAQRARELQARVIELNSPVPPVAPSDLPACAADSQRCAGPLLALMS